MILFQAEIRVSPSQIYPNWPWVLPCFLFSLCRRHFTLLTWLYKFLCVFALNTRAVRKVSGRFEYLENWWRGLDVTWQPVRGDLTVHP